MQNPASIALLNEFTANDRRSGVSEVLNCALMYKRGEPLDLMGSPIDARAVEVPKQTDCDSNRKIRKAR
jgi:hypothetical protein